MTRRGALSAIKAVGLLNLSPSRMRDAQLLCAARSKSTSAIPNHVINYYIGFLRKRGLPVYTFDERTLISFLHYCEDTKKTYSFMKQVSNSVLFIFHIAMAISRHHVSLMPFLPNFLTTFSLKNTHVFWNFLKFT